MAVIGWDVGGANIKAALVDQGTVLATAHRPFEVWRDPAGLARALRETAEQLAAGSGRLAATGCAVTMTAELADAFATKRDGVAHVLDAIAAALPGCAVAVWTAGGTFVSAAEATREPARVASANWAATAVWAGRRWPDALMVDVGSTTADIIPISAGRVAARACDDTGRLATGELVYTGALRTPLAAILREAPFAGRMCAVAAELFAIAADAHLVLGRIAPRDYTCATPDGRGITVAASRARLLRMVCADVEAAGPGAAEAIARAAHRAQVEAIARAMLQVRSRPDLRPEAPVVITGAGAFLARAAAAALELPCARLDKAMGEGTAAVAPAVAVALLWEGERACTVAS